MENRVSIANELFDVIEKMTPEQFNKYAVDFMGAEGLFNYIKNAIDSAEEDILKDWLEEAKKFL